MHLRALVRVLEVPGLVRVLGLLGVDLLGLLEIDLLDLQAADVPDLLGVDMSISWKDRHDHI